MRTACVFLALRLPNRRAVSDVCGWGVWGGGGFGAAKGWIEGLLCVASHTLMGSAPSALWKGWIDAYWQEPGISLLVFGCAG